MREVGYRLLIAKLESHLDPDPHDRSPRYYQHYGASIAVTAEMYAQAGGLPFIRTSENEYKTLLNYWRLEAIAKVRLNVPTR